MRALFHAALLASFCVSLGACRQIICSSRRDVGEIAALSAAIENYKADHGKYPSDPRSTELLRPNTTFDPVQYATSSRFLYRTLSGDSDGNPATRSSADTKPYYDFKYEVLSGRPYGPRTHILDPWRNSYGYSTFKAVNPESPDGNNPTFDLWSTAGGTTKEAKPKWTTNW